MKAGIIFCYNDAMRSDVFLKISHAQPENVLLICMIYIVIFFSFSFKSLPLPSTAQNTSPSRCTWKRLGVSEIGVGRRFPYVKPGQVSVHIQYTQTVEVMVDLHNGYTRSPC